MPASRVARAAAASPAAARRGRARASRAAPRAAAGGTVSPDEAHSCVTSPPQGGGYRWLDVRSARDYDHAHLTKVSSKGAQRVCGSRFAHNAHFDRAQGVEAFLARCEREVPSKTTGVVVCDACGSEAAEAAAALRGAGWETVVVLEGGWEAWLEVYTTTGRPTPPKGKWMSTGTEALKSGLNVGDVAMTYEEGGYQGDQRLQP